MDAKLEQTVVELLERMLDSPIFGDRSKEFIRIGAKAALEGEWNRATVPEMCHAIYGRHHEADVEALAEIATHVRNIYLREWDRTLGFRDEARMRFPIRRRGASEPPYLAVFEFAFGRIVVEEYLRHHGRHGQGEMKRILEGRHPLDPLVEPHASLLPFRCWAVRKRDTNILLLPKTSEIEIAPALVPMFVHFQASSTTGRRRRSEIRIQPRILSSRILGSETAYLNLTEQLSVTPVLAETLYMAWLCADYAHENIYTEVEVPKIFTNIRLVDLDEVTAQPGESFLVHQVLLVDETHSWFDGPIDYDNIFKELRPALLASARVENAEETVMPLLSSKLRKFLRGKVYRGGLKAFEGYLSNLSIQ